MEPRRFFVGRAIGVLIVLALVAIVFAYYSFTAKDSTLHATSPQDAAYTIDGVPVQLTSGVSEVEAAPGSATKVITRYFGNDVQLDLDDDGRMDSVFLLTQETGGSGTFYYVVAALNTADGYVGSHGILLGDRIAPQTTELSKNPSHVKVVVVNYAERAPGEPMTTPPSVGKSIWLKFDLASMQFGEVVQDFEGEADPTMMRLDMKPWGWVSTRYNDGRAVTPKEPGIFSVAFDTEGKFTATTDCNSVGGSYAVSGDTITFSEIFSTRMFCEGSQESAFTADLEKSTSYHFTSKGELILDLKLDSGSVTFK